MTFRQTDAAAEAQQNMAVIRTPDQNPNDKNKAEKDAAVKITDFLTVETIIPSLGEPAKKRRAARAAARLAFPSHLSRGDAKVLQVFRERERISTTAIGEGVAIPHGKLPGIDRVLGVFARSPTGVDFASLDGEPTYLFFALIAPEDAAADHLKALARISRLLKDAAFRGRLMKGGSGQELFAMIAEEDEKF